MRLETSKSSDLSSDPKVMIYSQIGQSVTDEFKIEFKKSQSVTGESILTPTDKLLRSCTFTHFVEFIKIDDDLKL